jgi:hypothetical protein
VIEGGGIWGGRRRNWKRSPRSCTALISQPAPIRRCWRSDYRLYENPYRR